MKDMNWPSLVICSALLIAISMGVMHKIDLSAEAGRDESLKENSVGSIEQPEGHGEFCTGLTLMERAESQAQVLEAITQRDEARRRLKAWDDLYANGGMQIRRDGAK